MIMQLNNKNNAVIVHQSNSLRGTVRTPSDKSISHRGLILGALCLGETTIQNLLLSEDVINTAEAMRQFGANIMINKDAECKISGIGIGGLLQPKKNIYLGNSGTSARLLIGLMSSCEIEVKFEGDESLSKRPMDRVLTPLQKVGLEILEDNDRKLPLTLRGAEMPVPIYHHLTVASAQVKTALILSALNISGTSTIIESIKTRDHTENLLRLFGADIKITRNKDGHDVIKINGQVKLSPQSIDIPGDPSSAAFLVVAGLIKPNSELEITNVMTNSTRAHFINVLKRMGANIKITRTYSKCGEDVCDMSVTSSELKGTIITKEEVPSLIDEFLILSVAAAYARGTSKFCGLSELRVKESNRFDAIINMLSSSGVSCRSVGDDIVIDGKGEVAGGSEIKTSLDHRTAMASFILGLNAHDKIRIDDISPISTSFPGFTQLYTQIGGVYKSE